MNQSNNMTSAAKTRVSFNTEHITVQQAAKLTNRDESTIRRWARSGKISATKLGVDGYVITASSLYSRQRFSVAELNAMPSPLLDTHQTANAIKRDASTVRRMASRGDFMCSGIIRTKTQIWFHADYIARYVREQAAKPVAPVPPAKPVKGKPTKGK